MAEKKLGDSIEVVGREGGKQVITREQFPDISDAGWEKMRKSAAAPADNVKRLPPPVPVNTPAPLPPNGATQRQVRVGGTPGTFTDAQGDRETVVNAAKSLNPVQSVVNAATDVGNELVDNAGTLSNVVETGKDVLSNVVETGKDVLSSVMDPRTLPDNIKKTARELGITGAAGAPPETRPVLDESLDKTTPGTEGVGSASFSMSGSSGDPGDSGYAKKIEDLARRDAKSEVAKAQIEAFSAEQQAEALGQKYSAQIRMTELDEQHAKNTMEINEVGRARLAKFETHLDGLKAEQSKLDPTIDPNRYWKNKSGGQIAMGAIAAGLFGFAGKGIDYLTQVQREIETDIDAQKATYEQSDKKIRRQMADAGDMYARAREQGLSDKEAETSAYLAKTQSIKSYIDATTTNAASMELKAKAMEARAGLDGLEAKRIMVGTQAAAQASAQDKSARAALINANAAASRVSAGGAGGKPLPGALAKQFQAYTETLESLKDMKKIAQASIGKKIARSTVSGVPFVGASGAADNAAFGIGRERFLRAATNAAIQKNDELRTGNVLADANALDDRTVQEIEKYEELTKREMAKFKELNKGYDLSGATYDASETGGE